ncbi:MAG: TRAP transporter substrate-binding protein [Spirochaetales bacterium]
MKQMRWVLVVVGLLLLASPVFTAGAKETRVITMRTSTNLAPGGTVGRALKKFVELVEQDSGGRIKATANFGSELGSQREQVEMTKTGALEMVVSAPGTGPGANVPPLQMFEFPYLFKDDAHYVRVLDGMEAEVSRLVAPLNLVAVGGQNMGSRHMLVKPRPIYVPDDLKGLKMRGPNPVYIAMFNAFGASGVTTDWNEIYNALQTGVIDGMEASPDMIYSMKFHEVAKHLSKTNHIAAAVYYFFRKDWLDSLPADLKQIVLNSARKAAAYQNEIGLEAQKTSLQKMINEGVQVNEVKDLRLFQEKVKPMLDQFRARGKDWSDFIDKIIAIQ